MIITMKSVIKTAGLILLLGLGFIPFHGCTKDSGDDKQEPVAPKEVQSVTLSQDTAEMTEGEQITLYATVLPKEVAQTATVIWSSSKNAVATVSSSGVVKAVSSGTTTIMASAEGKSAKCIVTVVPKKIAVTGISLEPSSTALLIGEQKTLTATVTPENATDKTVSWSSSDESVVMVNSKGVIVGLKTGSVEITASAGDIKAKCQVTVQDLSGNNSEGTGSDVWR